VEDIKLIDGLLVFSSFIDIQYVQSFEKGDDGIRISLLSTALRSAPRIPVIISHDREQTRNFSERRPARIHPPVNMREWTERSVSPFIFSPFLLASRRPLPFYFPAITSWSHVSSIRLAIYIIEIPHALFWTFYRFCEEKHSAIDLIHDYSRSFWKK